MSNPDWSEIVALMTNEPRPPFRAVVLERKWARNGPAIDRRVVVLHDGDGLWLVEDGDDRRLGAEGGAVFFKEGRVEGYRGYGHVSFDNGIKSLFHGRLMSSLDRASGRVVGTARVAGRECWTVEVSGLRSNEADVAFHLSIDSESGFVLEITRPDMPDVFTRVESIAIGKTSEPKRRPGKPGPPPRGPGPFPKRPEPRPPGAPRPFVVSPTMSDEELRRALFGPEDETG